MATRSMGRSVLVLAAVVSTLAIAAPAFASPGPIFSNDFEGGSVCPWSDSGPHFYCWTNASGGDWGTASNWRENLVPPYDASIAIVLPVPTFTVTANTIDPAVHDAQIDANLTITGGHQFTVSGIAEVTGALSATGGARLSVGGVGSKLTAGSTISVPGATLQTSNSGKLFLDQLASATGVTLSVASGGAFSGNALTSFTGGAIEMSDPTSTLHLPVLTNIDNTVLEAIGGSSLSLPGITTYTVNQNLCLLPGCSEVFANNTGSHVSLPNVTTITSTSFGLDFWALQNGAGGGHISLPALATINTPSNGTVSFTSQGTGAVLDVNALAALPACGTMTDMDGGELDATSLTGVAGTVAMSGTGNAFNAGAIDSITGSFQLTGQTRSYPGLTSLTTVPISVGSSGTLTLGGLTTASGSTFTVTGGGTLSMPALTSAPDASVTVGTGGTFSAAALTSLTSGQIVATEANSVVSASNLANIDNTILEATQAGTFSLPGVTSYSFSENVCLLPSCVEVFTNNTGSTIGLPNLHTITSTGVGFDFWALDNGTGAGHISLPTLTAINTSSNGTVSFTAQGAGVVLDLNDLPSLPAGATLSLLNGATVNAGSLTTLAGNVSFSGTGNTFNSGSVSSLAGSLTVAGTTLSYPLVTSIANTTLTVGTSGTLTLGGLTTATSSNINALGGGHLTAAALTSAPSSKITLGTGGSFTANALTSLTGGEIVVTDPSTSLSATSLANIDNTPLEALTGGTITLPAVTSYSFTQNPCLLTSCVDAFSNNTGSLISLPNVHTLSSTGVPFGLWALNNGSGAGSISMPTLTTISTATGGQVTFTVQGTGTDLDLSDLATLPQADTINVLSGGTLDATSLASIAGAVVFSGTGNTFHSGPLSSISGALTLTGLTKSFPQVTSLTNPAITVGTSGSLTLGGVTTATNTTFTVSSGGALAMGALTSAPTSTIMVSTGGSFTAGALTSLTDGAVEIGDGASSISAANLANIDNTVLQALTGGTLTLPGVASYTANLSHCILSSCAQMLANNTGSTITLANLTSMTDTGQSLLFWALSNGLGAGQILMHGLTTISTTSGSNVHFLAQGTGAEIDLTDLTTYDGSKVNLDAQAGGQILN